MTKLLGDAAPGCMKEQKFENYFGRKIAVDASMHIYSFLVRLPTAGNLLPACLLDLPGFRLPCSCTATLCHCAVGSCRW